MFRYIFETLNENILENIIKQYHKLLKFNISDSEKDWFNVGEYKKYENTAANTVTTPVIERNLK